MLRPTRRWSGAPSAVELPPPLGHGAPPLVAERAARPLAKRRRQSADPLRRLRPALERAGDLAAAHVFDAGRILGAQPRLGSAVAVHTQLLTIGHRFADEISTVSCRHVGEPRVKDFAAAGAAVTAAAGRRRSGGADCASITRWLDAAAPSGLRDLALLEVDDLVLLAAGRGERAVELRGSGCRRSGPRAAGGRPRDGRRVDRGCRCSGSSRPRAAEMASKPASALSDACSCATAGDEERREVNSAACSCATERRGPTGASCRRTATARQQRSRPAHTRRPDRACRRGEPTRARRGEHERSSSAGCTKKRDHRRPCELLRRFAVTVRRARRQRRRSRRALRRGRCWCSRECRRAWWASRGRNCVARAFDAQVAAVN